MSHQILRQEVCRRYRDQPEILQAIFRQDPTFERVIHGMDVDLFPVWLRVTPVVRRRYITLGKVNGIWTLCVAPKSTTVEHPEAITGRAWNEEGSLIHLSTEASSGEIGRLNTILFAMNLPARVWYKFTQREPTCFSVLHGRNDD